MKLSYTITAALTVLVMATAPIAGAQEDGPIIDPVEAARERNRALEEIPPNMDKLEEWDAPRDHKIKNGLGDVEEVMKSVNETLISISQVGNRSDQVAILLDDSLSIDEKISQILKAEKKLVEAIAEEEKAEKERLHQVELEKAKGLATESLPKKPSSSRQTAAAAAKPKKQEIEPISIGFVVKYDPAEGRKDKVGIKIGRKKQKGFLVGQSFKASGKDYTVASIVDAGPHPRYENKRLYDVHLDVKGGRREVYSRR